MSVLMWLGAVCVAVVAVVAFLRLWKAETQRGCRPVFLGRPDIGVAEIHRTFYAGSTISEEQLKRALGDISKHLGVPATRLRPTDRFDCELAPTRGWEFDDEVADLAWFATESLRQQGIDPATAAPVLTVDDYVRVTSGGIVTLENKGSVE